HIRLKRLPARALRPIIPDNACPLRIPAAAVTELAGAFWPGTVKLTPCLHITGSSLTTPVDAPKTSFTHAPLLVHTFVHPGRFPSAASRRSLGRVSVPVWPITLSGRLRIVALVGLYPTN